MNSWIGPSNVDKVKVVGFAGLGFCSVCRPHLFVSELIGILVFV